MFISANNITQKKTQTDKPLESIYIGLRDKLLNAPETEKRYPDVNPTVDTLRKKAKQTIPRHEPFIPDNNSITPRNNSSIPRNNSSTPQNNSFTEKRDSITPRSKSFPLRNNSFIPRSKSSASGSKTFIPVNKSFFLRGNSQLPENILPIHLPLYFALPSCRLSLTTFS